LQEVVGSQSFAILAFLEALPLLVVPYRPGTSFSQMLCALFQRRVAFIYGSEMEEAGFASDRKETSVVMWWSQ
jgi:hypothetical protein